MIAMCIRAVQHSRLTGVVDPKPRAAAAHFQRSAALFYWVSLSGVGWVWIDWDGMRWDEMGWVHS